LSWRHDLRFPVQRDLPCLGIIVSDPRHVEIYDDLAPRRTVLVLAELTRGTGFGDSPQSHGLW
jgi:hypothetical protein